MGLKVTRRAPGFEGSIVGSNTVTLRLPIGLTYHKVFIEYAFSNSVPAALALAAAVAEVRVLANGKPIWNAQASELDTIEQFHSRAAAAGILTVDFSRFNLRSREAEEFTSIGTGDPKDATPLTTFTIEMDLKAAVASGTLSAKLHQSEPRPLGLFKKLRRFVKTYTGAGTFEIADFPLGDLINSLYLFQSANNITNLKLERDNYVMFDRSNTLNSRVQTDGVRTPQSGLYALDTSEDGNGTDQISTRNVNDLRFFLTLDGAMTVTPIMEYIGALEV